MWRIRSIQEIFITGIDLKNTETFSPRVLRGDFVLLSLAFAMFYLYNVCRSIFAGENMKLTFIADTHYYSKSLGTSGKAYALRSGSDQKCLAETAEIIDAAFEKIGESDTDAVFILGDVTNNGEMVSHIEFREKLYKLKRKKPVYIITATHDWCCDGNPRRFEGNKTYSDVPVMKSRDLPGFYNDFGPGQAIDSFITDIGTVCYTIELGGNVRVLCLNDDKNENDHAGFTPACRKWIENQLENARRDGCLMIGIEHHLLLPHISPLITGGSTCVEHREQIAEWFADNGLRYMFVGHSHIQNTDSFISRSGNQITEVNVGALCGYPAPIVNVTVQADGTLFYEVDHLKTFKLGDTQTDAQQYLAKHACELIFNVTKCRAKQDFIERADALQLNGRALSKYWFIIKPLLVKIDTMLVWDAYKVLCRLGLAADVSKAEAMQFRYKSLREMIGEMWLSILDGSAEPHPKNSAYYKLVMCALSAPSKLFKKNKAFGELVQAADTILTGDEINNQKSVI